MTVPAEVRTAALFTATDRCAGRVPALVTLAAGGQLAFCDHHLRRHRAVLATAATRIERHVALDEALAFVPSLATR